MRKTISLIVIGITVGLVGISWYLSARPIPEPIPVGETPKPKPVDVRIVAFGDSLTAGYGLALEDAYPAQLERRLREQGVAAEVTNTGVSGETSAGGVRRAAFVRSLEPDIVLFGLGGNDALRLLSPEELRKNLDEALATLLVGERPPRVILLGMRAPANADGRYREAFDRVYPELAEKYQLPLVPFFLQGVALDPAFTQRDGIHPTREGYAKIVEENILPKLSSVVDEVRSTRFR